MGRTLNKDQSLYNRGNRMKIEGKPGRGKLRKPFLKQVIKDTGTYRRLIRNIGDNKKWRKTSIINYFLPNEFF